MWGSEPHRDLQHHGVRLGLYEQKEAAETPKSTEELWQVLKDAWNNPPARYLEKMNYA